jgi:thiol:disulfide interchange protein
MVALVSSILFGRAWDRGPVRGTLPSTSLSAAWESSFSKAERRARDEERVLMLYFGADWCGPCKDLEESTFKEKEVAELLLGVVPVKIDGSEMSGPISKLFRRYGVYSLPEIVFVQSDGGVVESARIRGFIDGPELAGVLREL